MQSKTILKVLTFDYHFETPLLGFPVRAAHSENEFVREIFPGRPDKPGIPVPVKLVWRGASC